MKIKRLPSPNFNDRTADHVSMLILHYTDTPTFQKALDIMCDPKRAVSAHYAIDEDGSIIQLVDEKNRAWHAGKSYWRSKTDINSHSIGIEIQNPGHGHGYRHFPAIQMESVLNLCHDILTRHPNIPPENMLAHSDIAPGRKIDPGELFDWHFLYKNGIGQWPYDIINITDPTELDHALIDYGYDPNVSIDTRRYAFDLHFRPSLINT